MVPDDLGLPAKKPSKYKHELPPKIKTLRDNTQAPKIPRVDLYQKLLDVYELERLRWIQFKNDARPADLTKQVEVAAYDRTSLFTFKSLRWHFDHVDVLLFTIFTDKSPLRFADKLCAGSGRQARGALDTFGHTRAVYAIISLAPILSDVHDGLTKVIDHRVRKYVGYVDLESASETLQRAKENLRASVTRSIDDTQDVYPVAFSPSSWARHLSTAFKPEDLLANEATTRERLLAAEKERASLTLRESNLLAGVQELDKLEAAEVKARLELSQANTAMVAGFGDAAISIIKMYFDVVTEKVKRKADVLKNLTSEKFMAALNDALDAAGQPPLSKEQFDQLKEMQAKCLEKQEAVQLAGEAYSRAQLVTATARGADNSAALEALTDRLESLSLDIEYYKKALAGSTNPLGVKIPQITTPKTGTAEEVTKEVAPPEEGLDYNGNVPKAIKIPEQAEGASVWQEIILTYKHNKVTRSDMKQVGVSHSDWDVGLFFGSASGSSDSSSTNFSSNHTAENTDIQIGMRIMKVAITRPWMNANVFTRTSEFFHYNTKKITSGPPSSVKVDLANVNQKTSLDKLNDCLLPSWTTGFIVAKDVHILMTTTATFSKEEVDDLQHRANSGGGFLCFSCNKSEASSDHREAATITNDNKTLSIKIAAPQILGWISQLCPEDNCRKDYIPLPEKEFTKEKLQAVLAHEEIGKDDKVPHTPPPSR